MKNKTIFVSNKSKDDAILMCKMSGYIPAGTGTNKKGQFVCFARKPVYFGM